MYASLPRFVNNFLSIRSLVDNPLGICPRGGGASPHRLALLPVLRFGSVIAGMIVTVLIFPEFDVAAVGQGAEAGVRLFAMAFGFGFGWHAIVDEVAKWAGVFKDADTE